MDSAKRALCQLPHMHLPVPVLVHEVGQVADLNDKSIRRKVARVTVSEGAEHFEKYMVKIKYEGPTQSFLVPWNCVIYSPGAEHLNSKDDSLSEETRSFPLDREFYCPRKTDHFSPGDYCAYQYENRFIFGRLVFVGSPKSKDNDQDNNKVYAFVATDRPSLKQRGPRSEEIHKYPLNEIYRISDFHKLQKSARCFNWNIIKDSASGGNRIPELVPADAMQTMVNSKETNLPPEINTSYYFQPGITSGSNSIDADIIAAQNAEEPNANQTKDNLFVLSPSDGPGSPFVDVNIDGEGHDLVCSSLTSCADNIRSLPDSSENTKDNSHGAENDGAAALVNALQNAMAEDESNDEQIENRATNGSSETGIKREKAHDSVIQDHPEYLNHSKATQFPETNPDITSSSDHIIKAYDKKDEELDCVSNADNLPTESDDNDGILTNDTEVKHSADHTEEDDNNKVLEQEVAKAADEIPVPTPRKSTRFENADVLEEQRSAEDITDILKSKNVIDIIGNCVAKENGTTEIKQGCTVVAIMKQDVYVGQVQMLCHINGIEKNIYAGIKFEIPLPVSDPSLELRHTEAITDGCKHCKEGRSVFVPCKEIGNTDASIFQVVTKNTQDLVSIAVSREAVRNFREEFEKCPILSSTLRTELKEDKSLNVGIDGRNNSCYADTLIFAMFAFETTFDSILPASDLHKNSDGGEGDSDETYSRNMAIINILKFDIVKSLRQIWDVDWKSTQKLRKLFSHYQPDCDGNYMDIEEFAMILFQKVLKAPEFLSFVGDYGDFIYQIFVFPNETRGTDFANLQELLEESFKVQEVALAKMPEPAFIIKLPVCDGYPSYTEMYPNPTICLDKICENVKKNNHMDLRAVICLKDNHFTCFVRVMRRPTRRNMKRAYTWFYHDSMPTKGNRRLTELGGFETLYTDNKGGDADNMKWIDRLQTTAYMCVYVPFV